MEIEAPRTDHVERALHFCDLIDFPLSAQERAQLACLAETGDRCVPMMSRSRKHDYAGPPQHDGGQNAAGEACEVPHPDEAVRKVYTIGAADSPWELTFSIDNYVHVTYFANAATGARCEFCLPWLAEALLDHYVEFSQQKFAKINLRYYQGLSHLLYTKSVLVETGSYNAHTSRRLLRETVRLLRERCGYPSLVVRRRLCQNIVATARVNFRISLPVLRKRFPDAKNGERRFAGVIVRLGDLREYFEQEDTECEFTPEYDDVDDDAGFIEELNAPVIQRLRAQTAEEDEQEDEQAWSDEDFLLRETDEYDLMSATKENGTFLVFQIGNIICTGLKSHRELLVGYTLLFRLLERCRAKDPANKSLERSIRARP